MAKTKVTDWDATASNNTDLNGTSTLGTAAVSNFDNNMREMMKQLADVNKGNQPVEDTWTFADPVDLTKKFRFDGGGITTATTRTYTAPNADGTLALLSLAQTWSAAQTFSSTITSGNVTSLVRDVDNSGLNIFGGTSGSGANIELYGGTHATLANQAFYDANTHSFRNANGAGTPTVTIGGNTVWHSGNDGAGSGLDADLLDGQSSAYYAALSEAETVSGAWTFSTTVALGSTTSLVRSVDNSNLVIFGGTSGSGANIELYGGTHASEANNAFYDANTHKFRQVAGSGNPTVLFGDNFRFNTDGLLSNGMAVTKTAITEAGTGVSFHQNGIVWVSRDGNASVFANRDTSDGTLVQFGRSKTAVGSISVTTTATAYNTSSSKTLKENWRDFDSGLIIDSLDAWLFDWKNGNGSAYGVLAQDAVAIFPDAVTADANPDLWAVDYSKFVPLLLKEVKDLRKRVAVLEAK